MEAIDRKFTIHKIICGIVFICVNILLTIPVIVQAQTLNSEIAALGDNQWKQLTLAPSIRRLCRYYLVDPADATQKYPQGRVQAGVQIGVFNGRSYLFYFGGGHSTHACNDVELFDVAVGKWEQQYLPEAPRLITGTIISATATTITLSTNASSQDNAYMAPDIIGMLTNSLSSDEVIGIASYVGATRTVTVATPWKVIPSPGRIWAIWTALNSLGVEYGFSSLLSLLQRPQAEHLQDYYKYDPVNQRFIGISYAATAAWDMITRTWEILAGPFVPENTFTVNGDIGMRSLMEYDPDLAARGEQFYSRDIPNDGMVRGQGEDPRLPCPTRSPQSPV